MAIAMLSIMQVTESEDMEMKILDESYIGLFYPLPKFVLLQC